MKKQKEKSNTKQVIAQVDKKILLRFSLLIFIFSFLIYFNTLHHGFVLDDGSILKENAMTQGGTDSLKSIFTSSYRAGNPNAENNLYRPLSKAMFAVEWQISPANPTIHHFVNILLYAFVCSFLFWVLATWTNINIYALLMAVLLFAAHPVHTEVVANIKSRDEILTMLFLLLSLHSSLKYLRSKKIIYFVLYLFCFFCALLSKESAIVFIALVPLTIYFFTESSKADNIKLTLSAAVLAIFYLILHKNIIGTIGLQNIPVIDNTLMSTPSVLQQKLTAIMLMGKYLLLLIFPHPLSSDYSFDTIPIVNGFGNAGFLIALLVHLFLLFYAIKKIKQKDLLSYCIFFYLISMSIASNIFMMIGTHLAERLLFFPSIAFCIAVAFLLGKLFRLNFTRSSLTKPNSVFIALTSLIVLLYSVKTFARNKDWKDNGTLFKKDIETVPNSAHMLMYYTDFLLNKDNLKKLSPEAKQAQLLKAQGYITRALKIYELFPDAHYLAGRIFYEQHNYESSYKEYFRALSLNPGKAMYHNNAGTSLFALGRFEEASKEFEKAMHLDPKDPDPPFNLGSAYGAMGESFRQRNDIPNSTAMFRNAIGNFEKAIRLKPDYKSAYQFLGNTYMNLGDTINGKEYLNKAAQIIPKDN